MTLGYTSGVYDLFHVGHLNFLRNAKALCDRLVVGVATDDLLLDCRKNRSVIPFHERMEIVRNVSHVDAVIPQDTVDEFSVWGKLKYDVMFVGDDWYASPDWKNYEEVFKNVGVDIVYFPYTETTSSTLLNEILIAERGRMQGADLLSGNVA